MRTWGLGGKGYHDQKLEDFGDSGLFVGLHDPRVESAEHEIEAVLVVAVEKVVDHESGDRVFAVLEGAGDGAFPGAGEVGF